MTMKNMLTLIAVDVAKEKLDLYNITTKKFETIRNDVRSIGNWLKTNKQNFNIDKIVLEPTGGYEDKLLIQINKNNLNAFFIHPNKFDHFKKGKREKAKTDNIDVFYIAEYGMANESELKPANKAHLEAKALKELVRTRRQLRKSLQNFQNFSEHKFNTDAVKKCNKKYRIR